MVDHTRGQCATSAARPLVLVDLGGRDGKISAAVFDGMDTQEYYYDYVYEGSGNPMIENVPESEVRVKKKRKNFTRGELKADAPAGSPTPSSTLPPPETTSSGPASDGESTGSLD